MADVPDEFLDEWRQGHFPANDVRGWLDDHPDVSSDVNRFMDEGLSMEWALAAADKDMPDVSDWDAVTIHRDADGAYDVIVSAEGETFSIEAAASDEIASDTIWGDFWFDVLQQYDIDVEKDFEGYGENN